MSTSLITHIVSGLAHAENVDPEDLDYHVQSYIDVDGLTQVLEDSAGYCSVTFEIETHEVTIDSDGMLTVDGVQLGTYRSPRSQK